MIGGELTRGASGGEVKRACIAAELVVDPGMLFLDEPTTGLDSETSLEVMRVVKSLARKRRVGVVCSIHQPNGELFSLFDNLFVLAKGHLVYNGPVSLSVTEFVNRGFDFDRKQLSHAEFISSVALHLSNRSEKEQEWLPNSSTTTCPDSPGLTTKSNQDMTEGRQLVVANSFWQCTLILLSRRYTMIRRDKFYVWSRIMRDVALATTGAVASYDMPYNGLSSGGHRALAIFGQVMAQSISSAHSIPTCV